MQNQDLRPVEQIGFPVRLGVAAVYEEGDREIGTVHLAYDFGLFAERDLQEGETVGVFSGAVVRYELVPHNRVRHVLMVGKGWCIVDSTLAQFANHSCDPNCELFGATIVTRRPVKKDEEITFSYDTCEEPEGAFWDKRWSFHCRCGSRGCRGTIDRCVSE